MFSEAGKEDVLVVVVAAEIGMLPPDPEIGLLLSCTDTVIGDVLALALALGRLCVCRYRYPTCKIQACHQVCGMRTQSVPAGPKEPAVSLPFASAEPDLMAAARAAVVTRAHSSRIRDCSSTRVRGRTPRAQQAMMLRLVRWGKQGPLVLLLSLSLLLLLVRKDAAWRPSCARLVKRSRYLRYTCEPACPM